MESTIGEPFLLSTYASPQQKSKDLKNVYVSHSKASGSSSDGYMNVAVQRDGIHVLDISTLHPIISHSLGPTTTFACAPVSYNALEGADQVCTTSAVVASSSELSSEQSGRTLWVWKENISSTALSDRASQKKKAVPIPHPIREILICDGLPSHIILVSPIGDLTLLDQDQKVRHTLSVTDENPILKTIVLPRKSCSFVSTSEGAIVVQLRGQETSLSVLVYAIAEAEGIVDLGSISIPSTSEFVGASCSPSGFLTIITRDGSWSSHQLEIPSGSPVALTPGADPVRLNIKNNPSIVSLGSSFVLLSSTTSNSPREILLLLWDVKFAVVLASHTFPIPASVFPQGSSPDKVSVALDLILGSNQVILVVSPPSGKSTLPPPRSSVFVVPYTVPAWSSIAKAMGRGSASLPYLVRGEAEEDDGLSVGQRKVIKEMRRAMDQNLPQGADAAFSEREQGEDELGYAFVKEVLKVVLQPSKPPSGLYSSEVVKHLLGRGVVSTNMLDGGLLASLRLRNDWQSIQESFKSVSDLTSEEITECLRYVVASHQSSSMQVDSVDVPALATFLIACVQYPLAPAQLKSALRRYFSDPEDVVCLLEVLDGWIGGWEEEGGNGNVPPLDKVLSFLQTLLDTSFLALVQHTPAHTLLRAIHEKIAPELAWIEESVGLRGSLEPFTKAVKKEKKDVGVDWRKRKRIAREQAGMGTGVYQLEELVL